MSELNEEIEATKVTETVNEDTIEADSKEKKVETKETETKTNNKKILYIVLGIVGVIALGLICFFLVKKSSGPASINDKNIKIKNYKGIKVELEKQAKITSKEVNAQIKQEMQEFMIQTPITDRGAQVGDFVTVDYTGTIDGTEFEGGKAEDSEIEITKDGSQYIGGFVEGIKGHKSGEEFDVPVTFPQDYGNDQLNGKAANFHFKLKKVVTKEMPKLTDAYVKKNVKGCKTVEEYKEKVKKDLKKQSDEDYKNTKATTVWQEVINNTKVKKYSQKDIDEFVNKYLKSYTEYAKKANKDLDSYLKENYQTSEKDFMKQLEEGAKNQAKQDMAVKAIADKEDITISDKEFESKLKKIAKESGFKTTKELLDAYKGSVDKKQIRSSFLAEKVRDFVTENANIKYVKAESNVKVSPGQTKVKSK